MLRLTQVIAKIGISKTHIYRLMNAGLFPKSIRLSVRVVAWDEAHLEAWLADPQGWIDLHAANAGGVR